MTPWLTLQIQWGTGGSFARDRWKAILTLLLVGHSGVSSSRYVGDVANTTLGYKTEGCPGDVNWCFTSAVGNSLPSTFFSYPNATIASLASSVSTPPAQPDTTNTDTSFLSFGTSSPYDGDYSPPTTDDWLASIGASDSEYNHITEALATTEYDMTPPDASSSSASETSSKAIAAMAADPAQAAYALNTNLNTAVSTSGNTVPSYRLESTQQGNRKRSFSTTSLPQRAFLLSSALQRHRFVARHTRAALRSGEKMKRDDVTPEQGAIAKGYADGWKAAKTFASFGGSRLGECCGVGLVYATDGVTGFTGQFVSDALSAMNGQIISSNEQFYRTWFSKSWFRSTFISRLS
jgi:hypothetical protein